MHIEVSASLQKPFCIDGVEEAELRTRLESLETARPALAHLEGCIDNFPQIKTTLLALRAANIPSMINLKGSDLPVTFEELKYLFQFLKDWDQLFLGNVLNLIGDLVPEVAKKDLSLESKIEHKWFQEWFVAAESPKLAGLPWRSYIRKIVSENHAFTECLLRFGHSESSEKDALSLMNGIKDFLRTRKKAVCIFPKNWGKAQ